MRRKVDFFGMLFRLVFEWLFTVLLSYFFLIIFVKTRPYKYIELLLLAFYVISYISRRRAPNNFIVLLAHIVPCVILYFMDVPRNVVWVIGAISVYNMTEAFQYMRTGRFNILNDTPWPSFLISVIIYAYGYFSKSNLLTSRAYIIPILLILTYFLVIYLDGIKKYVDSTKDVSGLPIKRIIKTNSVIVVLIMGMLIFGLALADFLGIDRTLYKILQGIFYVISMIFLVIRIVVKILLFFLSGSETGEQELERLRLEQQAVEYSHKIGNSLEFILRLALAGLAFYLFYKLMVWFIRLLMRHRKISDDVIEKADVSNKKSENYNDLKKSYFRMSKEETLRKLYRESIWHYRYDIKLNNNKTPQEISDELYDMQVADVEDITKIYRDVRYGGEKVTKEMLRTFKK